MVKPVADITVRLDPDDRKLLQRVALGLSETPRVILNITGPISEQDAEKIREAIRAELNTEEKPA